MEHRPGAQDSFSQLSAQITRLQTLAPSCVLSPAQWILNYFLYNERASVVELWYLPLLAPAFTAACSQLIDLKFSRIFHPDKGHCWVLSWGRNGTRGFGFWDEQSCCQLGMTGAHVLFQKEPAPEAFCREPTGLVFIRLALRVPGGSNSDQLCSSPQDWAQAELRWSTLAEEVNSGPEQRCSFWVWPVSPSKPLWPSETSPGWGRSISR